MSEFHEPIHKVWGAAEFIRSLNVPSAAPATFLTGDLYMSGSALHFFGGNGVDANADRILIHDRSAFGGDIAGYHSSTKVTQIQGKIIAEASDLVDGYAITYNKATGTYVYTDVSGFGAGLVAS